MTRSSYLLVILCFSSGFALNQSPDVVAWKGQPVSLTCSQVKTNNVYMSWYKQEGAKNARLQLILLTSEGSTGDPVIEKEFQDRFSSTGMAKYKLPLSLRNAQPGDTGTYFCAKQDYTERQLLRKPSINLFTAGCKYDGLVHSLNPEYFWT